MRNYFILAISLIVAAILLSCEKDSETPTLPKIEIERSITKNMEEAFIQYPKTIIHLWENVAKSTHNLLNAVNIFLANPNDQNLKNTRALFLKTVQSYLYTAAFNSGITPNTKKIVKRFYPGSTQPHYIIGSEAYPHSGLINDLAFSMELKALKLQQDMAWPRENSLGLSVIEILLYAPTKPLEAYQPVRQWSSEIKLPIRDHPNNRLREYLKLAATQLHADATFIAKTWKKSESKYLRTHASRSMYKSFVQQASEALYGLAVLNTGKQHLTQLEPMDFSMGQLSDSHALWIKPILTSVDLVLLSDSTTQINSPKLLFRADTSERVKSTLVEKAENMRNQPNKDNVYTLLESLVELLSTM